MTTPNKCARCGKLLCIASDIPRRYCSDYCYDMHEVEQERDKLKAALDDVAMQHGKGANYSGRLLKKMAECYGVSSAADIMRKERDALADKLSLAVEALEALADAVDAARDGKYKIDPFASRPARQALVKIREVKP